MLDVWEHRWLIRTIINTVQSWQNPIRHIIVEDQETGILAVLDESRKWVDGRFEKNIGIDRPTHLHGNGQDHAHIYGRGKNGKLVVIVNMDGTGSHGTTGRLHPADADALRNRGFKIPPSNIVEWMELPEQPTLLLE